MDILGFPLHAKKLIKKQQVSEPLNKSSQSEPLTSNHSNYHPISDTYTSTSNKSSKLEPLTFGYSKQISHHSVSDAFIPLEKSSKHKRMHYSKMSSDTFKDSVCEDDHTQNDFDK